MSQRPWRRSPSWSWAAWIGCPVLLGAAVVLFLLLPLHLMSHEMTYHLLVVLNALSAVLGCAAWFTTGRQSGGPAWLLLLGIFSLQLVLAAAGWLARDTSWSHLLKPLALTPLYLIPARLTWGQNPQADH